MNWTPNDYQWTLIIASMVPFIFGLWAAFRAVKAKRATNTTTSAPEYCLLLMGMALGILISIGLGYVPMLLR